jgi:hypothetical protein
MPIPQVNDRIKEAPVVALRAVFAGIGQILLTADKVRARAAEQVWTPERPAAPGQSRPWQSPQERRSDTPPAPATSAPPATATMTAPVAKAAASTPGVKIPPAAKAAKSAPAAKTRPAPEAKTTKTAKATKPVAAAKATTAPAAKPETGPDVAAPPLPGYDDLSLASLRARLRALDATTIQAMLVYEKAHAGREPVITMFERRLAKLAAG